MRTRFFVSFVAVAVTTALTTVAAADRTSSAANEAGVGFQTGVQPPTQSVPFFLASGTGDRQYLGETDESGRITLFLADAANGGKRVYKVSVEKCRDGSQHVVIAAKDAVDSPQKDCQRKPAGALLPGHDINLNAGGIGIKTAATAAGIIGASALAVLEARGGNANTTTASSGAASSNVPAPVTPTAQPSTGVNYLAFSGAATGVMTASSTCSSFPAMSTIALKLTVDASGSGTVLVQFFGGSASSNVTLSATAPNAAAFSALASAQINGAPDTLKVDVTIVGNTVTVRLTLTPAGGTSSCVGVYNFSGPWQSNTASSQAFSQAFRKM